MIYKAKLFNREGNPIDVIHLPYNDFPSVLIVKHIPIVTVEYRCFLFSGNVYHNIDFDIGWYSETTMQTVTI